jgi:hypothetical protein
MRNREKHRRDTTSASSSGVCGAPILDHGYQTDILISDGPNYNRPQVKTIEATGEDHVATNRSAGCEVDCVEVFARNSNRRYVARLSGTKVGIPWEFPHYSDHDQVVVEVRLRRGGSKLRGNFHA